MFSVIRHKKLFFSDLKEKIDKNKRLLCILGKNDTDLYEKFSIFFSYFEAAIIGMNWMCFFILIIISDKDWTSFTAINWMYVFLGGPILWK